MTIKRIEQAIEVIKYAIENGISVRQASVENGYANTYIKNIKADVISAMNSGSITVKDYDSFFNSYNLYEGTKATDKNSTLLNNVNDTSYDNGETVEEKVSVENGEKTVTKYFFEVPPTENDIKREFSVDDINTQLSHYWVKGKSSGYFVSANIKVLNKNFYTLTELDDKLKELLPNYTSESLPKAFNVNDEKAMFILISDDHAGAINEFSIFDNEEYTKTVYKNRLLKIIDEVKKHGAFDKCYVISLGDQMNGWSSKTTRGGHEVKSLSNKEQFDAYVEARKSFYDELFKSKITNNYHIIDLENSNHTGLGFSYMANKALDFYLEGKYPEVKRESILLPIDCFEYGNHVIAIGHGKDEKYMRAPMPINLDKKTDLYLLEYFNYKDYSPKDKFLTFYKGDLHTFNLNHGKFGRYINLPSIMGSSDYIELNFGKSRPGAIIEIIEKQSPNIKTIPVWF